MAKRKTTKKQEIMTIAQIEARNASEPKFGKGITVASGFDLGAKAALDSRSTVRTIEERDAHVTGNRAYEGMIVYVEADQKTYQLVNNDWKIFGLDAEIIDGAKTDVEDTLESTRTDAALSANQGKVLKEMIDAQSEQLTNIEDKVDQAIEDIAGLGTDFEAGLERVEEEIAKTNEKVAELEGAVADLETSLTEKIDGVEAKVDANTTEIGTIKTTVEQNANDIAELQEALEAEVERATEEEGKIRQELADAIAGLEGENTGLSNRLDAVEEGVANNTAAIEKEVTDREAADTALQGAIDTVAGNLATETTTREQEIARVEGLIADAKQELETKDSELEAKDAELDAAIKAETTAREEADTAIREEIADVNTKLEELEQGLDSIELTWDKVTEKPFDALGQTLRVDGSTLDVKINEGTLEVGTDGSIGVKAGVFASADHNHDDAYASKDHELNADIHLTVDEKANVAKIPSMETDITALKSTVGAASQHHIVMTKAEMEALENTRHGDICHVIEEQKTYILDMNDVDGDSVNPEWIEVSDFNSLVTVDWSIINNKPFTTIGEGLVVEDDVVKVAADGTTVEIIDGKISVKEGVYAPADHSHEITWAEIANKPEIFSKNCSPAEWVDGVDADAGLVSLIVKHDKESTDLVVKVIGLDNIERLVAVEYMDNNNIKIWSDTKESVTVTVFSYNFGGSPAVNSYAAIVGKAVVGTIKAGQLS